MAHTDQSADSSSWLGCPISKDQSRQNRSVASITACLIYLGDFYSSSNPFFLCLFVGSVSPHVRALTCLCNEASGEFSSMWYWNALTRDLRTGPKWATAQLQKFPGGGTSEGHQAPASLTVTFHVWTGRQASLQYGHLPSGWPWKASLAVLRVSLKLSPLIFSSSCR